MMAADASTTSELRLDVEELKNLLAAAQRQRVKDVLLVDIRKLETEITLRHEESQPTTTQTSRPVQPRVYMPTIDVKNYAWDQSDKFLKIYATVPQVETINKEQVTCSFKNRSFSLHCEDVHGKNYCCEVTHLMEEIDPAGSHIKIKPNNVVIMLQKKEAGKKWPYITTTEKKIKDKPEIKSMDKDSTDPNESIMNLMKKMYEEGDDDMKRTIAKAWTESQEKQGKGDMGF